MMDGDYPRTYPACCQADKVLDMMFDEGGGQIVVDGSGFNNHGTMVNMEEADWVVGDHTGRGCALNFDGDPERVDITSSASLSPSEAISVFTWFYPDQTGATAQLISKWGNSYPSKSYLLEQGGASVYFYISDGVTQWSVRIVGVTISWHSGAGRYDRTELEVFLDGVGSGTPTVVVNAINVNATNVHVATRDNLIQYFNGRTACSQILNRALSDAEMLRIHEQPRMPLRDDKQCEFLGAVA